jgi:1,2-phenylacetyl-CoA epoxidase catalytic subunit
MRISQSDFASKTIQDELVHALALKLVLQEIAGSRRAFDMRMILTKRYRRSAFFSTSLYPRAGVL